ncbi:MAG: HAD hydrolase-like protein [Bacteroidetes bacterium]|nr:HAD hydrolase-like protein [Bacteroidota bacterium]
MKVFHTPKSLVEAGRIIASTVDTVSFDLFDTLLIRRIHDPDLVKLPVARFIAEKAKLSGLNFSPEYAQSVRDSVEKKQRQETSKQFKDHEACYPIFMRQTLEELFHEKMSDDLLSEVTAYEMTMENAMLVPRFELVEWLKELYRHGKTVFIVSDVYLPAAFLKGLVQHAGFSPYVHHIVSSADTFLAKASGEAFPFLKENFQLKPDSWIHIGDNPISDGVRPTEFGISALVLDDHSEKQRKAIIKRQLNYSKGRPFWRGRVLQQLMLPLEEENKQHDPLYIEGHNFLAPLIGVFIQKIAEKCVELSVEKIFFLSREGYTFKKYWEQAVPFLYPNNKVPETEYLYVSRMALAGASCAYQGLTKTNADIVFLPAGNRDFRDICRVFNLDIEGFETFFKKYQLNSQSVLSPLHDGYTPENTANYHALLEDEDFQDEIRKQTRPANDALQLYLDDLGFFDHENVALVDIGWLGTIPRFFYEAIQHRDPHPSCHNLLFGATRGIEYPKSSKNNIYGLIYDKDRFDFAASSIIYSRDFFEEACKAPHPTLNGYKLKEDGYSLEFRQTDDEIGQAEKIQDRYFAPLQQGMFDGASKFGAASVLLGFSSKDYKPWLNYLLVSKMAFPAAEEVSNIRHQSHLDDFHGTHKPSQAFVKGARKQLWDASRFSLRWNPILRIKYFLRHLRERLNE